MQPNCFTSSHPIPLRPLTPTHTFLTPSPLNLTFPVLFLHLFHLHLIPLYLSPRPIIAPIPHSPVPLPSPRPSTTSITPPSESNLQLFTTNFNFITFLHPHSPSVKNARVRNFMVNEKCKRFIPVIYPA